MRMSWLPIRNGLILTAIVCAIVFGIAKMTSAQTKELNVEKIDENSIEITWEYKELLQKKQLLDEKMRLEEQKLAIEEALLRFDKLLGKFE